MVPYAIDTTVACSATSQSILCTQAAAGAAITSAGPTKNGHMENGARMGVRERRWQGNNNKITI